MNITLDFLKQDTVLLKAAVIPLADDAERGVHLGIYGKQHFQDVSEFAELVGRISPITQEWYDHGTLESAFNWYEQDNSLTRYSAWLQNATRTTGSLRDWISELGVDIDAELIPAEISGRLHFDGNALEFALIADCPNLYADVFLADRV